MKFLKYHPIYYWTKLKDSIKYSFVNRQSWLTRKIPRHWYDKDGLIEIVLFECLKNYVEDEVGKEELFDKNRWSKNDNVPSHQLKFEKELKIHYNLLTINLIELERELEIAWSNIPTIDLVDIRTIANHYHNKYGTVDKLENKLENLKDQICSWIILNRRSMWT